MEVVLIIFFLLIILSNFYKSKIKGIIGEKTVSSILNLLDKSEYKIINDVVLKAGNTTTQIDHLVISNFGIFVIETKNYKGWILGYENSEYWTQVIFKRKEKFYNPIRQNLGHIKAIKNCLNEFSNIEYISIIAFSSNSEIKVKTTTDVVYTYKLIPTIKKYSKTNLTEKEKEEIFNKINEDNIRKTYNKKLHVKYINEKLKRV
ncbi:nuclease-related domain-containing protein [Flavobacterium sp.]|uniref:nuclease-related domain-containing protein n=1 Tax=Flavobacterium sp. TaxID=239 RepID=UPI0038CF6859